MHKCAYTDIISNASKTNQKFVDMEFHPNIQIEEDNYLLHNVEWIRIEEYYRTPILKETTALNAIKQGKLGDCHIISALISISQFPHLVNDLFETPISIDSGAVCVNFHYLGDKVKVIVDTTVPIKKGHLIFSHPQDPNSHPWWFSLVEKAYAKLFGSFTSLNGGNSHAALFRLIGGWPFAFYFKDTDTRELIENGKLFSRMHRWSREGYPMCCGSLESESATPSDQKKNEFNIRFDHAYAILRVVKHHDHKLIYLRNTYGKSEWSGRWGINSNVWKANDRKHSSKSLFEKLKYNNEDDGNFWISFNDFVKNFSSLFVDVVLKSYWKKSGVGGVWNEVSDTNENEQNVDDPSQISIDPNSMHQWILKFNKPLQLKCTFEKVGEKVSCYACLVKNGGKKLTSIDKNEIENSKTTSIEDEENDDDDLNSENQTENEISSNQNYLTDNNFMAQNFPKNTEVVSFRWDIKDVSEPWTLVLCRQKCNKDTSFYLTIYTVDDIQITNV